MGEESPFLHAGSYWCGSIRSHQHGAALGSCRHLQPPWAPAAGVPVAGLQPPISWRRPAGEGTFLPNTLKSLFFLFFFLAWVAASRTACKWQFSAF